MIGVLNARRLRLRLTRRGLRLRLPRQGQNVIVGDDAAAFLQIGDGAMVVPIIVTARVR